MTTDTETDQKSGRHNRSQILQHNSSLCVNSSLFDGICNAINGQHVRRDAVIDAVHFGVADHIVKCADHEFFELFVYHGLFPEIALAVLHPLEVRRGYATSIAENVWNDENAFLSKDFVRCGGGGTIGAFSKDSALHPVGVATGDLILGCGRNQNFALGKHKLRGISAIGFREPGNSFSTLAVFPERFHVNAVLLVQCAIHFDHADNFVTCLRHEAGSVRADISEPLNDDSCVFGLQPQLLDGLVTDDHDAAPSGFAASSRSTDVDRFTGHDRGDGLTHVHGVSVHHPRHDLFVGVHVGSGDVFFGADELDEFSGVTTSHAFQLAHGHLVRIANDATLCAAEWNIHYGTFPGHPTGESPHLVERDIRRIANASFRGSARYGMLHTKSGKDFEFAIVHRNRDVDDELAVGVLQNFPQAFIQIEFLRGEVEARGLRLPGIDLLFKGNSLHRISDYDHERRWPVKGLGPEANLQILDSAG